MIVLLALLAAYQYRRAERYRVAHDEAVNDVATIRARVAAFAGLLAQRGYDAAAGEVIDEILIGPVRAWPDGVKENK
jgi:hypothetical protein